MDLDGPGSRSNGSALEPIGPHSPSHNWCRRPLTNPTRATGPVADCSPVVSYAEAQAYYADHPDAQPVIDSNEDGRACEVYFGIS